MLSTKALIAFGADALLVNNNGQTPLDLADNGSQEMHDLLLLSCLSSSSEMGSHSKLNLYPGKFC